MKARASAMSAAAGNALVLQACAAEDAIALAVRSSLYEQHRTVIVDGKPKHERRLVVGGKLS